MSDKSINADQSFRGVIADILDCMIAGKTDTCALELMLEHIS